jgi:hypothetical protein
MGHDEQTRESNLQERCTETTERLGICVLYHWKPRNSDAFYVATADFISHLFVVDHEYKQEKAPVT